MKREPRQQRSIATKMRILSAATEEFSRHGFAGARVDSVAQAAEVNKQLIYAYFGAKKNLYADVIANVFAAVTVQENKLIQAAEQNPESLTRLLVEGYSRIHRTHPHFWRLLAWSNLEREMAPELPTAWKRESYRQLHDVYHKAQAMGAAPHDCTFETYIFTITAVTIFGVSNQHSMSVALEHDLSKQSVQRRIQQELLAWLVPGKA